MIMALSGLVMTMGAQRFDNLPIPGEEKVIDNTPDSIAKALMNRPQPGSTRQGDHPVLFLIGNSTMRNGTMGNGNNGQWGWGYYANQYFDGRRITVENQALGGMSTRTFYTDLWPAVRNALKPGDWVVVSIGHNDTADFFDQKRARGVIPGVDPDTMVVGFNERKQQNDTVYSYGTYLRRYISDIRAKGAHPILMSLTPRNAYDEWGKIIRKPQTQWAAYVAEKEGVPFVDLNELSGAKLDSYSPWKRNYHFYGDKIHTSKWGAELNARSAAEGIYYSKDPQLIPLKAMMQGVELPVYQIERQDGKPVVFITGDSTVKNTDKDEDGMWGWGSQAAQIFDPAKITWVNAAMAGRSTRSYLREGRWEKVYNSLRPGDYVLIQFGHNDIGDITDKKGRASIACTADTSHVYLMPDGRYELVYSFGWYLKKMIDDTREKGATPILLSLTPRNEWPDGRIERRNDSYGKWYREVVDETGVEFVDVHNISADFLDRQFASHDEATSKANASKYFNHDHTHTSKLGAQMNARSVMDGLKASHSSLADYTVRREVVDTIINKVSDKPFYFSVPLSDGNYKVTVTLGSKKKAGHTVVRAESRRLMVESCSTKKGEFETYSFIVNKRSPEMEGGKRVSLKPREHDYLNWDDLLTLEFNGKAPAVKSIRVEPDTTATTVFLCGNSTVVDQELEPWASWGQMIPRWFTDKVAISNHAESGLTARTFINGHRLDKVLSMMKKGDYVVCEFGHNDQKEHQPGDGAWYHFPYQLKIFIDRVREAGGNLIFITPTQRRRFDDATHTKIQETHGDYPDAMREVARREGVPVIEIHDMTRDFFETLGFEGSKRALVHYPANTFPGQEKALEDNTHFNPYGAYEVAKMVVMGLKQQASPLAEQLRPDWQDFDPKHPDDPEAFVWYPAEKRDTTKPDGN